MKLCCFTAQGEKLVGALAVERCYQLMHHSPAQIYRRTYRELSSALVSHAGNNPKNSKNKKKRRKYNCSFAGSALPGGVVIVSLWTSLFPYPNFQRFSVAKGDISVWLWVP